MLEMMMPFPGPMPAGPSGAGSGQSKIPDCGSYSCSLAFDAVMGMDTAEARNNQETNAATHISENILKFPLGIVDLFIRDEDVTLNNGANLKKEMLFSEQGESLQEVTNLDEGGGRVWQQIDSISDSVINSPVGSWHALLSPDNKDNDDHRLMLFNKHKEGEIREYYIIINSSPATLDRINEKLTEISRVQTDGYHVIDKKPRDLTDFFTVIDSSYSKAEKQTQAGFIDRLRTDFVSGDNFILERQKKVRETVHREAEKILAEEISISSIGLLGQSLGAIAEKFKSEYIDRTPNSSPAEPASDRPRLLVDHKKVIPLPADEAVIEKKTTPIQFREIVDDDADKRFNLLFSTDIKAADFLEKIQEEEIGGLNTENASEIEETNEIESLSDEERTGDSAILHQKEEFFQTIEIQQEPDKSPAGKIPVIQLNKQQETIVIVSEQSQTADAVKEAEILRQFNTLILYAAAGTSAFDDDAEDIADQEYDNYSKSVSLENPADSPATERLPDPVFILSFLNQLEIIGRENSVKADAPEIIENTEIANTNQKFQTMAVLFREQDENQKGKAALSVENVKTEPVTIIESIALLSQYFSDSPESEQARISEYSPPRPEPVFILALLNQLNHFERLDEQDVITQIKFNDTESKTDPVRLESVRVPAGEISKTHLNRQEESENIEGEQSYTPDYETEILQQFNTLILLTAAGIFASGDGVENAADEKPEIYSETVNLNNPAENHVPEWLPESFLILSFLNQLEIIDREKTAEAVNAVEIIENFETTPLIPVLLSSVIEELELSVGKDESDKKKADNPKLNFIILTLTTFLNEQHEYQNETLELIEPAGEYLHQDETDIKSASGQFERDPRKFSEVHLNKYSLLLSALLLINSEQPEISGIETNENFNEISNMAEQTEEKNQMPFVLIQAILNELPGQIEFSSDVEVVVDKAQTAEEFEIAEYPVLTLAVLSEFPPEEITNFPITLTVLKFLIIQSELNQAVNVVGVIPEIHNNSIDNSETEVFPEIYQSRSPLIDIIYNEFLLLLSEKDEAELIIDILTDNSDFGIEENNESISQILTKLFEEVGEIQTENLTDLLLTEKEQLNGKLSVELKLDIIKRAINSKRKELFRIIIMPISPEIFQRIKSIIIELIILKIALSYPDVSSLFTRGVNKLNSRSQRTENAYEILSVLKSLIYTKYKLQSKKGKSAKTRKFKSWGLIFAYQPLVNSL